LDTPQAWPPSALSPNAVPAARGETPSEFVWTAEEASSSWWVKAAALTQVQLLGALVIGVLLPGLFHWSSPGAGITFAGLPLNDSGITNALIGGGVATLLGFIALRQLKMHPGVNSAGYVLYAFGMTYGALAVLLLFLRADYSRYELTMSFLLILAWFLGLHRVIGRNTQLRLAVLPSPDMRRLPPTPKVRWIRLAEPNIDPSAIGGVVADLRADHAPEWERFMARCALAGVPIYDVKQISEQITGRVEMAHLAENTFMSSLHGLVYAKLKRPIDLVVVLFVAPAFLLAIAAAAIAIRLDDGGQVLFRQVRVGHRGRPFVIYKLRTMRAEPGSGQDFTTAADPRITRLGSFLRKYRIDELPQIWNILKGEMSWIGPRPETTGLSEWYEREVPFYCYRHMMRPGITGWAQVNQGNVAKIAAVTEKLHYDFYYIKHLSPWLDLLIGAKTAQTILSGFGST
jgi:lipopolysaccharide/colanic/teichoic acid biosynthesis glycosyltransferase